MSALSDEVKTFIVQQLACFDPPSVVVKAVKAEFGEIVTPQQVEAYNPERRAGQGLSEGYREVFRTSRERFLQDTASIGISHRTTRLRTLQRLTDRAEAQGNMMLAAQLLAQAAKEVGNAFTNRHELTGKDGAPIEASTTVKPDIGGMISGLDQNGRDALRTVLAGLAGRPAGGAEGA